MPEATSTPTASAEGETSWEDRLWSVGKSVLMFVAVQYAFKSFMGGGAKPAASPQAPADSSQAAAVDFSITPYAVVPMWPADTTVDVSMYVSEGIAMPKFEAMPTDSLVMEEKGFSIEKGKSGVRDVHAEFAIPRAVQDNGTLFAHIFVGQSGAVLDPASKEYDTSKAYRILRPLTQYLPKKKVRKTRNLLGGGLNDTDIEEEIEEVTSGPISASYYHPNTSLQFIPDAGNPVYASLHPAIKQFYPLDVTNSRDGENGEGKNGYYYPVIYHNTFWQLKSHMLELNRSHPIERLELNVQLSTLNNWQFNLMASMDEGMKETARKAALGETTPGGGDGSEFELIKETLLDTNPWLLGTTAAVSVLHMIFELLAFKSDVGHWRKKKDNVGVSVRTILSNVVMQTIIFLYLLDNNEHTSWMILFGQGTGIAIEAWKVTKAVNVRVREPGPDSMFHGILPRVVVFEDKHQLSETEEKTEEYDKIAFKWMGIVAVPLLAAYAGYSLMYESHKSWYSFIITTLVGSVYAYGFLMMVPSLYINYRLRSVAHMPGRAMGYKVLNTFIDDLFAFTIKMPILHRLATLRDDVIFFVYLYQAWAYKVDYSRVNEFGQGGDEEDSKDVAKPAKAEVVAEVKDGKANGGPVSASGKEGQGGSARKRKG